MESGQALAYDCCMGKFRAAALLVLMAGAPSGSQSGCDSLDDVPYYLGYTDNLGDYTVEKVSLVPKPPSFSSGYKDVLFLRVDLASKYRLSIGPRTYWITVASDFCPLPDHDKLLSSGPYVEGGEEAFTFTGETLEKSPDGLFRYHVYVYPQFPIPGVSYGAPTSGRYARMEYDLLNDGRNLCLRIVGGDNDKVFARSSVIEVDARLLKNAAASHPNTERKLPD